jgi:hypothetical protein
MENQLKPQVKLSIKHRSMLNPKILVIAALVALLVIVLALIISLAFQFSLVQNLVMSWILTTFYAVFAFFLIEPKVIKIVNTHTKEPIPVRVPVPYEVIKQVPVQVPVPIQIPIENKTIEIVEKPVEIIREVPVIKRVIEYREKPRKKLNIPKYKFIASSQAKTYHKRTCRLSKLIKKKYKIHSNSQASLKRKHFKPCKVCIRHLRKI